MMEFISIPLTVGIVALAIYKLFELFVCRKERLTMIEKLGATFDPSMIANKFSFPDQSGTKFGTLKVACLLLGVGLGLLVGFFIITNKVGNGIVVYERGEEVVYGASTMLFGGLGLLISFLIEMYFAKKDKE